MSTEFSCGAFVTARIHSIAPDAASLSPYGRAALANLRRGVGKAPGSVPQIWEFTMFDDSESRTVRRERNELAVHVALTHWAFHQQSKKRPMHDPGRSFGEALRLLASSQNREKPETTAAYRRMMALASSRSLGGITTHARGLIGLLRTLERGFDYGRWADDLYWIQVPGQTSAVQRRWGRDFYRLRDDQVVAALEPPDGESPSAIPLETSKGAAS